MSQTYLTAQLRNLPSSRKKKKLTPAELQAKNPRVELRSVLSLIKPKGEVISLKVWIEL